MSHLVSKQSHLDVLACDFNMSDVLHIVAGQLEKRKTAGKKTDHVTCVRFLRLNCGSIIHFQNKGPTI